MLATNNPKYALQTPVVLLWLMLISFPPRRNLKSRWESVLQDMQKDEDRVYLHKGQCSLVLRCCFLFFVNNTFKIELIFFPALALTDVLSSTYQSYKNPGWYSHSNLRKTEAQPAAISFYYSLLSQHLSLTLSFDPILPSCKVSL